MFKELLGIEEGTPLPEMTEPPRFSLEIPSEVITKVKLEPRDLAKPESLYKTWWHMFFVDPTWYCLNENRKTLARFIPCFVVAKVNENPFRNAYFSGPEPYQLIDRLLQENLVLLPITQIRKKEPYLVKLMGINLNIYSTQAEGFSFSYYNSRIIDACLFGKFSSKSTTQDLGTITYNYKFTLRDLFYKLVDKEEV